MDKAAQNAAIGKRLRQFRQSLKIPRARFAREIGYGSERIASYESGRAPLPYTVFAAIAKAFPINPIWLAVGGDRPIDWEETVVFPSAESLKVRESAAFLDVYHGQLAPAMQRKKMPSVVEILERQVGAAKYSRWINTLFRDVPFKHVGTLDDELEKSFLDLVLRLPADDAIKNLQTQLAYKNVGTAREFGASPERFASSSVSDLTKAATHAKHGAVNSWHKLKQRIRIVTASPGAKTALAAFLNVDITQLSRWLNASKAAREPGADYTLKMLQWVQERERQQ